MRCVSPGSRARPRVRLVTLRGRPDTGPCACSNHVRRGSMSPEAPRGRMRPVSARSTLGHLRTVVGLASQSTEMLVTSPAPPQDVGRSSAQCRRLSAVPVLLSLPCSSRGFLVGRSSFLSSCEGCRGLSSLSEGLPVSGTDVLPNSAPCWCRCEELTAVLRQLL